MANEKFPDDNLDDDDWVSKTQRKKEVDELQDMGEELQLLSKGQLAKFNLSDKLQTAIEEGQRLRKREALRRHRQFLGRVMREEEEDDIALIRRGLWELKNAHQSNTRVFKELEEVRERLIQGDNSDLGSVIAQYPEIDTQKLRQLVKQSKKEVANNAPPAASRKLFRFLRETQEGTEGEQED
ncbi:MAG: DUF615 domain-containing protein [Pseudomonadales bacterium]|nr:DUF615 domain-containing protein [Pseudomonadales bacterium]